METTKEGQECWRCRQKGQNWKCWKSRGSGLAIVEALIKLLTINDGVLEWGIDAQILIIGQNWGVECELFFHRVSLQKKRLISSWVVLTRFIWLTSKPNIYGVTNAATIYDELNFLIYWALKSKDETFWLVNCGGPMAKEVINLRRRAFRLEEKKTWWNVADLAAASWPAKSATFHQVFFL